jgi:ABC-2 type transport system permease protein
VRKLRHDSTELVTRAVQPALWLLLFGQVMAQVRGITAHGTNYLDFLAPGILGQSVLFAAIFYGINTIWERDLGVLHRYLVSPAPTARSCSARPYSPLCADSRRRSSSRCWR